MSPTPETGGKNVPPAVREWIETVLAGSPVATRLGIRLAVVEADRVVAELPFRTSNVTVGDIVHGGVIATLVDIAGAAASGSAAGEGASGGATSSMTLAYLAPAKACALTAEAIVIQRGRTQAVSDIAVRDDRGTLVAKALVTSRIFMANR